jgi:hypothetical protein
VIRGSAPVKEQVERFVPLSGSYGVAHGRTCGRVTRVLAVREATRGDDMVRPQQSPGSERGRVEGSVSSMKERSPFTELVWQRPGVRRALVGAGLATLGWAIAR